MRPLGTKGFTTTTYHPPTNGLPKLFYKMMMARQRFYVAEHLRDLETYVQPLAHWHYAQVHCFTNLKSSTLLLPRHPTVRGHSVPDGSTH